jgi:hypothetical protein
VLREHDTDMDTILKPRTRADLNEEREQARTRFEGSGDLQAYSSMVSRLRSQEAELPAVTFWVLDQLGATLESTHPPVTKAELKQVLAAFCQLRGRPAQWSDGDSSGEARKRGRR